MEKTEYSWQALARLPYGSAIWDLVIVNGQEAVMFMAHEKESDAKALPSHIGAHFRSGLLAYENVSPVVVLIDTPVLGGTLYEMWFNFYGASQADVQHAFEVLGKQPVLFIALFDTGPEHVRVFTFVNTISHFFSGVVKVLRGVKPWTDSDFDRAKAEIQKEPVNQLWQSLGKASYLKEEQAEPPLVEKK